MDAVHYAKWVLEAMEEVATTGLQRVNSLATDTCATMQKVWRLLEKEEKLRHVSFVPCDAHGLQLLIKVSFFSILMQY